MPPVAFSLSVPLDARYRALGPEVAAKYIELQGGAAADVDALAAALTASIEQLAGSGHADDQVHLVFRRESDAVAVELRCGGRSTVVRHLLPAASR